MSRKKGFSIGAAMKERMNQNEQAEPQVTPLSETPLEVQVPTSADPGPAPVLPVRMATPSPTSPATAPASATADFVSDPLESFNTRLPRSLHRRLKVHVALNGQKIQDVMHEALDEYLSRHGS